MAQKGKLVLLKMGDGGGPEVFTGVCGMRSKSITINNATFDTTVPHCTDPGQAIHAATLDGVKSMEVSGAGLFTESQVEKDLTALAMAESPRANFQFVVPGLGTFEGEFSLGTMQYTGPYDDAAGYDMTLSSSGEITFTAE